MVDISEEPIMHRSVAEYAVGGDFPERIWVTQEDIGQPYSGAPRNFRCTSKEHGSENPEYVRADLYAALQAEAKECEDVAESDGYDEAVQDIDILTGGDGEYFASPFGAPDCRDAEAMKEKISKRFSDLQSENDRLNAELAQTRRKALGEGIEQAAKFVEARLDDYVKEHGMYDHETGATEFPDAGEYAGELEEIIEGVRALIEKEA